MTGWFHSAPFWPVVLEQQSIKWEARSTVYWMYLTCVLESSHPLFWEVWVSSSFYRRHSLRFSDGSKSIHLRGTRSQETDAGHPPLVCALNHSFSLTFISQSVNVCLLPVNTVRDTEDEVFPFHSVLGVVRR